MKSEQSDLEKWKKAEKDAQDKIDEDAKHLDKFATKQNLLEQKISESLEKINQLGALPSDDLYAHYRDFSTRSVITTCIFPFYILIRYNFLAF